jgi:hypothetical protein
MSLNTVEQIQTAIMAKWTIVVCPDLKDSAQDLEKPIALWPSVLD